MRAVWVYRSLPRNYAVMRLRVPIYRAGRAQRHVQEAQRDLERNGLGIAACVGSGYGSLGDSSLEITRSSGARR